MRKRLLLAASAAVLLSLSAVYAYTLNPTDADGPAAPDYSLTVSFTPGTEKIADGFTQPLFATHANDARIFVVEKPGLISIVQDGQRLETPYLDIRARVGDSGYEQGLLGLAFHPNYQQNGKFYVNFTDDNGDTNITEFTVRRGDPNSADPNSARRLMLIPQPYANHNGGMIAFGPDGYLYIGMGDGGGGGDPLRAGQDKNTLLGKILRIDVNTTAGDKPYGIPPGNAFASTSQGLPEIWSYGWRNPWRFSFDRSTGDMWSADVGQNAFEEIHFEKAGGPAGQNYGWAIMEGMNCFPIRANCDKAGLVMPVAEYSHSLGISVTGGYVYRGEKFPAMQGIYFVGDFGTTRLWGIKQTEPGKFEWAELAQLGFAISSFGEDAQGELYITDFGGGGLYQLVAK
jgi:glucose/arabinose dehydrogenase